LAFEAQIATLPKNATLRVAALLDWAMTQVDKAIDTAGVDNVVMFCQAMYDKYIAPLDVPWVPDAAEPAAVDLPAKWLIGQVIRGFHEYVHQDDQPVVVPPPPVQPPTGAAP